VIHDAEISSGPVGIEASVPERGLPAGGGESGELIGGRIHGRGAA
jgi:hypothetical protein